MSGTLAAERHPGGEDQETGRDLLAVRGGDVPVLGRFVVGGRKHPGAEGDGVAQVEAFGHVLGIAQEFRLAGVALGPHPLLLEFLGEAVGVLDRLDVTAGTGVAVPVPGSSDVVAPLERPYRESQLLGAVDAVEPAKPCADDDEVKDLRTCPTCSSTLLLACSWFLAPRCSGRIRLARCNDMAFPPLHRFRAGGQSHDAAPGRCTMGT